MKRVKALVKDLFFAAKIEVLLRAHGLEGEVLLADAEGLARLREAPPDVLVFDLGVAAPARDEVLRWAPARLTVIAFGSHVEGALLEAARRAGCAAVTTNGALERELPGMLAAHLA